ncbi:MAG: Maf family protein, partial [Staphylothermus sp.]|nr:Maf family protein [Staphylothermus sp.]
MRKRLVLATSSARRIELLKRLGIEFDVVKPMVDERIYDDPVKTVVENARRKAEYALGIVPRNSVVVGIDTIIYSSEIGIVGKPYSVL